MRYSSYQVERLIDRLRRLCDWLPWPYSDRWHGDDPVRMSHAAREAARAGAQAARPEREGAPSVPAVQATESYAPVVEAERERRAGSFMVPPYPDDPPPGHIPRVGKPTGRPRPRPVAEGD